MQYFGPGFYKKGPFEQENKTKVHILFICSFWGGGGLVHIFENMCFVV